MKDKFIQLIASMTLSMDELVKKVNGVIAGLPPVEQHEASGMVLSLKRELGWVIQDIERAAASSSIAKVDEMIVAFEGEVVAAAIAAKKVVTVEEVGVRIEAAENAVRATVENEFKAAAEKVTTINTRRATLVADLGEVVAAQFTDDMIIADSFDAEVSRAKYALDQIKESGIDSTKAPKAYGFVCASILKPVAEFTAALELAKEAALHAPSTPTTPVPVVTIHANSGKPEANPEAKKPTLVKAWA